MAVKMNLTYSMSSAECLGLCNSLRTCHHQTTLRQTTSTHNIFLLFIIIIVVVFTFTKPASGIPVCPPQYHNMSSSFH
ncbi:hypothetical protein PAMP_007595 [Pampus punctatissimus]